MDTDRDLLAHHEHAPRNSASAAKVEQPAVTRFEAAVKVRYGSALKPRYCQSSFGDNSFADRHERMNKEIKRSHPSQCQFTNSAVKANNLVTIPEARPFSAISQARNTAFAGQQNKKHTDVKNREIAGSNLMAEIEATMKTLLQPTKDHRAKVLEAVLGSR